MKYRGIKKQLTIVIICAIVLVSGMLVSVFNFNRIDIEQNEYVSMERVRCTNYIRTIESGWLDDVPMDYIISKKVSKEQSVQVVYVHSATGDDQVMSLYVGSIIPVTDIFQSDSNYENMAKEYPHYGQITFVLGDGTETSYVTFFYQSEKIRKQMGSAFVRKCLVPMIIAVVLTIFILIIDRYRMKKYVFEPIDGIREVTEAISHGDFSKSYRQLSRGKFGGDEIVELVYSFELMRDELDEHREKEERLKQTEQELISCITHDLQTPLSTIKAYCEGIRDGVAQTSSERSYYNEVILKKTNTMIDMIKDLLAYSNAQLGEMKIEKREVVIEDYFRPVLEELVTYASQNGAILTYEMDELRSIIDIDERRVTQVMYNLIENAMKYMDKPEKRINIAVQCLDTGLHVKVSDNGMGIRSEDILYIFDKFYRSEKSRNSAVPGSGLGLSICKFIMEAHQGYIWCESKLGEGTNFYLIFPMNN